MRSLSGNLIRDQNGLLYGKPRKQYTRKHPYPKNTMRIPLLQREAAAYIQLRKKGYSINQLSKAFGRSTSVIHRKLQFNVFIRNLRKVDMRKLPHKMKLYYSSVRTRIMMKYMTRWTAWILGEAEKPP